MEFVRIAMPNRISANPSYEIKLKDNTITKLAEDFYLMPFYEEFDNHPISGEIDYPEVFNVFRKLSFDRATKVAPQFLSFIPAIDFIQSFIRKNSETHLDLQYANISVDSNGMIIFRDVIADRKADWSRDLD